MGESRQQYSDEFKEKTVQYIQEQTKSVPQIAEELNIPAETLHQWLAKHRKFENEPLVDREAIRQKDHRIEEQATEIEDLKEEIAILKKAMHFFSKERK
ncbi:transposase [Paenibacillus sp. FSL H8-0548]|uniref:transposase n=1 Tax=Paenibacillus sp. FSL H8-0548 TaxID=1920422 RepID=UPI00096C7A77|nr:transposase [Paenibacillus sp. FSL H8-0548]OMF22220.1 transposase [Paenibacillus sp. FSL H8-0548]